MQGYFCFTFFNYFGMKKIFYSFTLFSFAVLTALSLTSCDEGLLEPKLTNEEIIAGLREALSVGTDSTVKQVNALDGYYKNTMIKILFPPEAQKAQEVISALPGGQALVDQFVMEMNRSAEAAAKESTPIFKNAIMGMTIADGYSILKGSTDTAATNFLRKNTFTQLHGLYTPKIKDAMTSVGAQQTWESIANQYNAIPFVTKINPDISNYVTGRALHGLFLVVAEKERDIRKDPTKRVTDILRKVFDPSVK